MCATPPDALWQRDWRMWMILDTEGCPSSLTACCRCCPAYYISWNQRKEVYMSMHIHVHIVYCVHTYTFKYICICPSYSILGGVFKDKMIMPLLSKNNMYVMRMSFWTFFLYGNISLYWGCLFTKDILWMVTCIHNKNPSHLSSQWWKRSIGVLLYVCSQTVEYFGRYMLCVCTFLSLRPHITPYTPECFLP